MGGSCRQGAADSSLEGAAAAPATCGDRRGNLLARCLQGTLVRRHKLPKEDGGVLSFGDLAVGSSVRVYGR